VKLSKRELQILELIVSAHSAKQIAGELGTSEHTVAAMTCKIYRKVGIDNSHCNPRVALTLAYVRGELEDILEGLGEETNEANHVSEDEGISEEVVDSSVEKR
jgi:hypothetical protein